jgi:AcrR family transcriptional regulator
MDKRKDLVLDAARERFLRFGVKKTTMDEVSGDAGISKKTLYEFFRSKEDLFLATFIREALANRDFIMRQVEAIDSPLEKIKCMVRTAVDRIKQEKFMIQVLSDESDLYAPYLKEPFRLEVESGILDLFVPLLEEGMRRGEIRPLEPRPVAYFMFKLFQAFTYAKTASIQGDEQDLGELIDFVLEGISAR